MSFVEKSSVVKPHVVTLTQTDIISVSIFSLLSFSPSVKMESLKEHIRHVMLFNSSVAIMIKKLLKTFKKSMERRQLPNGRAEDGLKSFGMETSASIMIKEMVNQ